MDRITYLVSFLALIATGCNSSDDDDLDCLDGKCDVDVCEQEARYNNGTCDTECAQADIDCFRQFDDRSQADAWFGELEARLAMQELREPRALVPADDPRFVRMRALLDQGWESYRQVMPVGLLDKAPELVVIEEPVENAFVARDQETGKVAWVVLVQSGLIDPEHADHGVLGVVMHELTHATALHVLPGVADRLRIHYQVEPGGAEPFGFEQNDDPRAREAITAWRDLGEDAGAYAYAELNGMPAPGSLLSTILNAAIGRADPSACGPTGERAQELQAFMTPRTAPLTGLLEITNAADASELDRLTRALLEELRDGCLAGSQLDVFELMAEHFGVTPAEIEEEFPAAEQAVVAGRHVIDQITFLAGDRHRRMREIAALLESETGRDITSLRYFSSEEAADDSTVPVLRDMQLPVDGIGQFFRGLLPEPARSQCNALIEAGTTPPYGDLVDEHHATCWRADHVKALAARPYRAPRALPPGTSSGVYRKLAGDKLPRWRLPSDDTSHALHRRR
jgi:hypothetical protein